MTEWLFNGIPLKEIPEGAIGFVYLITFSNNDRYVGKKNFYSTRKVSIKGRVNRKIVVKESDWRKYNSSSDEVKARIKAGEAHKKEILHFGSCKGAIMYLEVKEMIIRGVLCDSTYLNKNILSKIFRCYEPMVIQRNNKR